MSRIGILILWSLYKTGSSTQGNWTTSSEEADEETFDDSENINEEMSLVFSWIAFGGGVLAALIAISAFITSITFCSKQLRPHTLLATDERMRCSRTLATGNNYDEEKNSIYETPKPPPLPPFVKGANYLLALPSQQEEIPIVEKERKLFSLISLESEQSLDSSKEFEAALSTSANDAESGGTDYSHLWQAPKQKKTDGHLYEEIQNSMKSSSASFFKAIFKTNNNSS